jgi:DNA-binding transcriptional MerR regulator
VYSGRDRARLQLILRGRRVGLSLAEIGELLALYDRRDGGATQMAASLTKFGRSCKPSWFSATISTPLLLSWSKAASG